MTDDNHPSLLEEVAAARPRKGPPCTVAVILEALNDKDAADLRTLLRDKSVFSSTIATVLERRGHLVGDSSLQRHRRGKCECAK